MMKRKKQEQPQPQPQPQPEKPKWLWAEVPPNWRGNYPNAGDYVLTQTNAPSRGRWYRVPMELVEVVEIEHVAKVVTNEP